MQKAQDDLKQTAQDLQAQAKQFADDAQAEVKAIQPVEAGIAFGVALFLAIGLHVATKQKEDPVITFGLIVYALITGALALLLRKKEQKEQFVFMIVVFSFLRLVFDITALSVISLSFAPVLVNLASEEAKKHIKTQ